MPMSRQHYEVIAEILKREKDLRIYTDMAELGRITEVKRIALILSKYFKEENPSFDEEKFINDVGINL